MTITKTHTDILRKEIFDIYPISENSWNEIRAIACLKTIDKNDFFSKENESIKNLSLIFKGIFRIYYLDVDGNEWNKHFLRSGDFMAASVSLEKKSITNIQALTDAVIIYLPLQKLLELSQKHNDLLLFIQKLTFSYLEQKQEREINLLSETALNNYQTFNRQFPDLENNIQHFHIASYLGITPTQLSRIRKKISHQQM